MNQVPAVVNSTAGTAVTSKKKGTATVTMTTEVEADIAMIGITAMATLIIGGDDTKTQNWVLWGLYGFAENLQKQKVMKYVDSLIGILRLFVPKQTSWNI